MVANKEKRGKNRVENEKCFHSHCEEVGVPMGRILTELKPPSDVPGLLLGFRFNTFRQ